MKLRKADEKDIQTLVELYLQGYKGLEEYAYTHPEDAQAYMSWLFRRDADGVWIAEDGGRSVGFVAGDGRWFSKREGVVVGAIHELVVLPEFRRRGIGRSLVEKVFEYFREKGLEKAELWVGDENTEAMNFYKKLGFEERDRFNYWVRMTKRL
ncbi:MAG: GNAT family N-acetyltransferase [Aquificaceae bacterium]|nr:GNAT family N-acetyltransferase [Aquificaceae bacterium]